MSDRSLRGVYKRVSGLAGRVGMDIAQKEIERRVRRHFEGDDRPRVPQKKMKYNPTNALAGRAATKKTGKVKLKSRKSVKVSKGLREKVKKVIAGDNAYGKYSTRFGGMIGFVDCKQAIVNLPVQSAVSRDTNYYYKFDSGPVMKNGNKVWWGGFCAVSAGNLITTGPRGAFVFFTPAKILDAASVLFNGKAVNPNWTLTPGNFSYNASFTTGLPFTGTSTLPVVGPFKVYVHNSYATWNIKNVNQRTVKMKIYHCVSKTKFQDAAPLTCIARFGGDLVDSTTVRAEVGALSSGSNTPLEADIICHPMFEPKSHPYFNTAFKYELTEIVLKLGEEIIHRVQGPKNYELNYNKLSPDGNTETGTFFKDTTKCCMVSVEVDQVFLANGTDLNCAQAANRSSVGTDNTITNPIAIEIDEVYKISCPATAGFITTAGVAGTIQQLNLKGNRQVYANFNFTNPSSYTYTSYNEEQPGLAIPEAQTN